NTTYQDIRLFLAGRTYTQGNHLCSCPKRNDGCPNGSLAESHNLSESKSTFHDGLTSHCHGGQATKGEHYRFPNVDEGVNVPPSCYRPHCRQLQTHGCA